ncbi:MAG: M6 family metalloprotease domain-containing protein [Candidatus Eisenbacteria bacterium]|nr:M6 family metalloprotease domain-containing protein [Candidatus Eisenbacteria bacterium]
MVKLAVVYHLNAYKNPSRRDFGNLLKEKEREMKRCARTAGSQQKALTLSIFNRYALVLLTPFAVLALIALFIPTALSPAPERSPGASFFLSEAFSLPASSPSAQASGGENLKSSQDRPVLMPLDPDLVQSYHARGLKVPYARTEAAFVSQPGSRVNRVQRPAQLNATSTTTLKALVILVKFTTNPPGGPATRYSPGVFDSMIFGTSYIRGGADTTTNRTLKNFLKEISYDNVDIVTLNLPSSVGWVTVPNAYTYYCQNDGIHDNGFGPYPTNAQGLTRHACIAADPLVDFSQYAVGGVVQNLFIVHSGTGAEWSGDPAVIWSHAWGLGSYAVTLDGVTIDDYSMEPECGGNTTGYGGAVTGPFLPTVGVYAHEFGHVLGLPDEYDYGYQSQGTGRFSLMAGGSWNRHPNVYPDNAGNAPAHPSAWGIAELGFVTPTAITQSTTGVTLPPIKNTPTGSMLKVEQWGTSGKEYWLLENRQQLGFDQGFIRMTANAHGLLIWHVDENVFDRTYWRPNEAECVSGGVYVGKMNCKCGLLPPNGSNGEKWYGISVEQADGLYELELNLSGGNAGDFYSSFSGKTTFNASTTPNSSSYYGCNRYVAVTNIAEAGGNITLDITPDAYPPLAVVVSPNGGESWLSGTSHDVTWTATDSTVVDSTSIYLSTDGGATYPVTLAHGETNDGIYSWTVSNLPSTQCKIKVRAYDRALNTGEDVSNAVFTIQDAYSPSVTVLTPNGGETWTSGTLHSVTWTVTDATPGDTASIHILFSTDGGATYPDTVARNEVNDGSFFWLLPDTSVSQCKIKVEAYDKTLNMGQDVSDSLFTIEKSVGVVSRIDPIPARFEFAQAYPNPFNSETIFRIALPAEGDVHLAVFDTRGRLVRTVLDQRVNAGWHNLTWNGRDDRGAELPAGVYLAKLLSGSFVSTKKVVLLK